MRIESGALRLPIGLATAVGLGLFASAAQADDYTVGNTADAGTDSLRDVIASTNSNPGADRILFKSGLTGDIVLKSDLPPIEGPIDIAGPGPAELAIDGDSDHRPFAIYSDATISGLTLKNARSPRECEDFEGGGGYSCHVTDGGAIQAHEDANLSVDNVVFKDNMAQSAGGGAISTLADLSINNSAFERNSSGGEGGAVQASADFNEPPGDLEIRNSVFTGNKTTYGGGGAVAKNSWHATRSVAISGSTFSGNESAGNGGAVEIRNYGPNSVTDSTFTGNTAHRLGGGMFLSFWGGPGRISGSLFNENGSNHGGSTEVGGGGLAVDATLGGLSLENSTFTANETSGRGGAILAQDGGSLVADSITAVGNTAGDGALFKEHGQSTLRNSIVSGNTGGDLSGDPAFTTNYPWPPYTPAPAFSKPAGTWETSFSFIGTTSETALVDGQAGSNIVGDSSPELGSLADNGGPTQTMLPATTSPVVNQGSTDLVVDQRGLVRPIDFTDGAATPTVPGANGADIGAVELRPEDLVPIHGPGPESTLSFGKVTLNKQKGIAMLSVKVSAAGKLTLVGSEALIGRKMSVAGARTVKLKIRARGKAAQKLRKLGKSTVRAKVRFAAAAGGIAARVTSVKLVKKTPKKKKK
ncbi:MAG: choice-of-anchor Q domain-containing protein [Solirubrobacterales bacterium]